MEKSNLFALGAVVLTAGFTVGRLDGKSQGAPAAAVPTPAAATAGAAPASEAPAPAAAEPVRTAEAPAPAPTPAPAAPAAPAAPSLLDSQSDEGAGKGADLAKIATSPKSGSPYLGPKDALVVVNVFSDYQCPVCRRSADPIKQLVLDFPGKVKVVFRNNALEMHGRSKPAALAALAAGKQGKYWQYHDKLFQNQALDDGSLRQFAQELGLDMAKWDKDVADPANAERVKAESSWAEAMGASGTPAFFVNGVRQVGWGSYLALKSMVQREVEKGEELIAQGTPKNQVIAKRIAALADKNHKNEGEGAVDAGLWAKHLTAD